MLQRRDAFFIFERNVVENDMPLRVRQHLRALAIMDRLLEIEHVKHAVDSRHGALERAVDAREALHRVREVHGVRQERDERAGRHDAVHDLVAAEPYNKCNGQRREELDRRRQEARQADVLHGRLEIQRVLPVEAADLIAFAHERLHDADGRNAFLQQRCDVRRALLDQRTVAL